MSPRKIPDVPWRTFRIAAAAVFATLLMAALLVKPAEAQPGATSTPTKRAAHQTTPPRLALDLGHLKVVHALKQQAATQATQPKHTASPARKTSQHPKHTVSSAQKPPTARPEHRTSRSGDRKAAPAPTVAGAKGYARSRLSSAQYTCLDNLIRRESGWNPQATNPTSGAYGLMQALPDSKMASAGSDWRTNPTTQIKWGLSYIQKRYGSPCGAWDFWQANKWY
ncbi:aggregation-promoting factor C-terminal-like domain-containing protein [Streptomyces malaysiensis]|uniref:Transglycosylase SLT domain-containing protein n=1 Tax=Streptomyces malaysiensis TaxID=92644 RepID=A0A7X5X9U5_STRMQ|nr:transglycosylase SLT domain-containing protein [Streptomyces malaysiensis]NIY68006.1 hypothetical protein [Streptomyces malaysiensis]